MKFSNIKHLVVFDAVAQERSLTAASAILGMQKSNVSHVLKSLEHEAGEPLFSRHARGISLTPTGDVLWTYTKRVLYEQDQVDRQISGLKNERKDIKIAMTYGTASFIAFDKLKFFMQQYPDYSFDIIGNDEYPDIETNGADVAISLRGSLKPGIVSLPFCSSVYGLYASKDYLEKMGTPKTPKDLDNHQLLGYKGRSYLKPLRDFTKLLHVGESVKKPRTYFITCNLTASLLDAARRGLGIMVGPQFVQLPVYGSLVQVLPELHDIIELFLCYRKNSRHDAIFRQLHDYITKEIS